MKSRHTSRMGKTLASEVTMQHSQDDARPTKNRKPPIPAAAAPLPDAFSRWTRLCPFMLPNALRINSWGRLLLGVGIEREQVVGVGLDGQKRPHGAFLGD
ncbi:hypothetical protein [Microvirgula aerodenitrificans]|uniref:hypothetical protein n=1 Tax=Microvirgula aerodenitrificans TaxID=57480 RepID=UPI00131F380E|nr:hypothetical protein [Microvirgula aerodenitrificans]